MRCTGLSVDLVTMNRQQCANESTTRDVLSLHHRSSPCFQRPQRAWPMVMVVTTATCATYAVLLQVGHTVFPPWPMLIDETRQCDSSDHGSVFIPKEKEIPPVLVTPRGSCWKTNHMHGQRIRGRAVSRLRKTDPSSNGAHHFLLLHPPTNEGTPSTKRMQQCLALYPRAHRQRACIKGCNSAPRTGGLGTNIQ